MAIRAVFFDFDGVLTLAPSGSFTTNTFLSEYYGTPRDEIDGYLKRYNDDLLLGVIEHKDIWQDVCNHFFWDFDLGVLQNAFESTRLDPVMLDLAGYLRERNIRTGMITDNKNDRIVAIDRKFSLGEMFEPIIVSSVIRHTKKDAATFELARTLVQHDYEEILFIDNTKANLETPAELGMVTWYFDDERRDVDSLAAFIDSLA
jgi:putative hydrolase of the HAD superfamily